MGCSSWKLKRVSAMIAVPLKYSNGGSMDDAIADVLAALLEWRDHVGPEPAIALGRESLRTVTALLHRLGLHTYTAWLEPFWFGLYHYVQNPTLDLDDDLLAVQRAQRPLLPGADPRPLRPYVRRFEGLQHDISPPEVQSLRLLRDHVHAVAQHSQESIVLGVADFLTDGLAILGTVDAPTEPPVVDEA